MLLPPLADVESLGERLGVELTPGTADHARAAAALDDASSLVRSEAREDFVDDHGDLDFGDLPARSADVLVQVTLSAALRSYRNPQGATQTSVGDVSVSFQREGNAGAVFLTLAEVRAVRRAVGVSAVTSVPLATPYMREA